MPYFITDSAPSCDGWATIKEDGEVIGCHATKQAAIDQMVAVSIAENMEPGGERVLPLNYRPALADDVPEGRACGNCVQYDTTRVMGDLAWCEKWDAFVSGAYYCNSWQAREERQTGASTPAPPGDQITGSDENEPGSAAGAGGGITLSDATRTALRNKVSDHNDRMTAEDRPAWTRATFGMLSAVYRRGAGAYSTSHRPGVTRGAWAMARVNAFLFLLSAGRPENANYIGDNDLLPADHPRSTRSADPQLRQVEYTVPDYMRDAAAEGLEWYRRGLAGDGVVDRTIREAREMARGRMSEDKVIRANAWAARHAPDLVTPANSDRGDERFPGPGAVAHALWGINPTDPRPARAWLARTSDAIKEAERTGVVVIEKRHTSGVIELRTDGDGMTFEGYAAVFGKESEPLPFIEVVDRGAFRRTLRSKNNTRMFVNHDVSQVLATVRSKTMQLEEDDYGLRVTARLPDTTLGRDMAELIRTRVVDSMSFGFTVPRGGDRWEADGMRRTLREVRLHEVSIVTGFPAYPATSATVRTLDALAGRAEVDADALAVAITDLEGGNPSEDTIRLLDGLLAKLRPLEEITPDVAAFEPKTPVSVLLKQLDLASRL